MTLNALDRKITCMLRTSQRSYKNLEFLRQNIFWSFFLITYCNL